MFAVVVLLRVVLDAAFDAKFYDDFVEAESFIGYMRVDPPSFLLIGAGFVPLFLAAYLVSRAGWWQGLLPRLCLYIGVLFAIIDSRWLVLPYVRRVVIDPDGGTGPMLKGATEAFFIVSTMVAMVCAGLVFPVALYFTSVLANAHDEDVARSGD